MHYRFLSLAVGIFTPVLFPTLPSFAVASAGIVVGLFWLVLSRGRALLALFAVGLGWGCLWGQDALSHRLPLALDKTDVIVTGTVSSIPRRDDRKQSFSFEVESVTSADTSLPPLRNLRLSWYGGPTEVALGQRWQLTLRLRAPRGFSNPGTFDYESWLFAEGVSATGYVIANQARLLDQESSSFVTRWRQWLYARINQQGETRVNGYLTALVLGEKGSIPAVRMGQLIDNGLIHLMVVSGLHIGIMATLGFWLGSVIGRALSALGSAVPATVSASLCSLMLASLYAALSGFGLPAQRALVMVGVVLWALLWRRPVRGGAVFTMALAGVALVDPAAVLRMGFWLSFAAVGALLFYFAPRPATSKSLALIVAQPVVFAGLAPWLLFFQGRVNLLMMPFNLLFIPWISFVVTPLCLLGAIFQPVPEVGDVLWQLARWQLSYFDQLLGQISSLDAGGESWWYLYAPAHSYTVLTVALLATMPILLLPSGSGLALCGVLLTVVLLVADPAPEESTLLVTVLDVGQGTAVVVRAGEKTLVYDTGAGFSDSFDAGSGIIAPYLASKGVRSVDTLVISHNDGDHSGGARGLLSTVRVQEIFTSDPGISKDWGLSSRACRRGQSWQWQSVEFRFLWPESLSSNDNNNSCVLLITLNPQQAPGVSILLPGDIEASVERLLVSLDDLDWTTVVIAPHHGSKTSSSSEFVKELRPLHVVFSAGFNHHFGHPHEAVMSRYQHYSQIWSTAKSGAVEFEWSDGEDLSITTSRERRRHYW